jgi:hypothetical protein
MQAGYGRDVQALGCSASTRVPHHLNWRHVYKRSCNTIIYSRGIMEEYHVATTTSYWFITTVI